MNQLPPKGDDDVTLSFPTEPGYLSLCRVSVSAMGSMLDFSIDELDELRLAVTEAVTWLLEGTASNGRLDLRLSATSGSLTFLAQCPDSGAGDEDIGDLASAILGATVDEFDVKVEGGLRKLRFSKSGL